MTTPIGGSSPLQPPPDRPEKGGGETNKWEAKIAEIEKLLAEGDKAEALKKLTALIDELKKQPHQDDKFKYGIHELTIAKDELEKGKYNPEIKEHLEVAQAILSGDKT